jgi:hypothetical protein
MEAIEKELGQICPLAVVSRLSGNPASPTSEEQPDEFSPLNLMQMYLKMDEALQIPLSRL